MASGLWPQLDARWEALQSHASGIARNPGPGSRDQRTAAHALLSLAGAVPARDVVEVVLAMFLMGAMEPRRFPTDQGFRAQLVRRVRGLSDLNAGTYWDHESGRVKRVYRDLPLRATVVLGQWLAEAFGAAGLHLARLEELDREKVASERQAFQQALEELR